MKAKKWIGRMVSLMLALCLMASVCMISASAAGQKVVYAKNEEELKNALASNTTIMLEGKDYYCGVYFHDLENLTIQGTYGTRLICGNTYNEVVEMSHCKNIKLCNLIIGHDEYVNIGTLEMHCTGGVVGVYASQDVLIENCDIFGCGLLGLTMSGESTVTMVDSTIRDCSDRIMDIHLGSFDCQNCVFSGNGYFFGLGAAIEALNLSPDDGPASLTFSDCTFIENANQKFIYDTRERLKVTYNNCTFTNNRWEIDPSTYTPQIAREAEPVFAAPTPSTVLVNGIPTTFDAYNIKGANYFKLRDLAFVLNGTGKQFSVDWDASEQTISLTSGAPYIPVGGEMSAGTGTVQSATTGNGTSLLFDKVSYYFQPYNIGGNNYFKLRNLGRLLDFGVDWDAATNTVIIDTTKGYTA